MKGNNKQHNIPQEQIMTKKIAALSIRHRVFKPSFTSLMNETVTLSVDARVPNYCHLECDDRWS
jgi:hypothetical protein